MAGREHLGEFEQIVLLAILRLGDEAYGVPIRQDIEQRTGRALTVGALYRTLDRLEDSFRHAGLSIPTDLDQAQAMTRVDEDRRCTERQRL